MTSPLVVDAEFRALIPPLSAEERAGLEAALLRDGCMDTLKVWRKGDDDILLDGHNRAEICERHGIAYQVEPVLAVNSRDAAIRWMAEHQCHRRNLNEAQRSMLAALLAPLGNGQRKSATQICAACTQEEVAQRFNVGRRSVQHARKVQSHGTPELIRMATEGKVGVAAAADVATLPVAEQSGIVSAGAEAVRAAAGRIRRAKRKPVECQGKASPATGMVTDATDRSNWLSSPHSASPVSTGGLDDLLPCMHCGSEAELTEDFDIVHGPLQAVVCQNHDCGMQTPLRQTKDEARNIWNRRFVPCGGMPMVSKVGVQEENGCLL